ncbi:MAG: dihydroorotase [Clostridiales bacterium]|jgi:dihydroorotase|nr:dihydroorotase [Clostridiales bacterium]
MKLLIKNCRLLNKEGGETFGDILIQDNVIMEISEEISAPKADIIDARRRFVLPGLIDMHCGICEPGYENKEDISSVSKSAVKGGYTSICCLPDTSPVIDNKTVVKYILVRSREVSKINVFPYGSMTKGCAGETIAEIGDMKEAGIVAVSDGDISVQDAKLMRNILLYSRMFDMPVIALSEDTRLSCGGVMNMGRVSAVMGLQGIPREAEEVMAARNILLAKYTGARLHIPLVSAKGTVELIRIAKSMGVRLSCDTAPRYFTLTEDSVSSFNTLAKTRPPLRTQEDADAIVQGLADGTIDVIASGHAPETPESKKVEFDRASYGFSAIETAFAMSYAALVETGAMSFYELIKRMAETPARMLGLEGKGELKPGAGADLIVADFNETHVINSSNFASKAKYSPYDGREVKAKVIMTIVGGNVAYLAE